ncbi:YtxH domain-containing protein [Desulfovibrio sp. JC010]|uniref:YtxH domain-containing protein n=1 Tax=Desulfovibrio sp. JC010 TaxID=2593641 RepID=UPI0013D1C14F|nr:YtxH domain-containing protein [Desulfovibrio sp. JC010]NDV28540.1 YtxH domain-containing protein [Desulfovibrio sp. JC010]
MNDYINQPQPGTSPDETVSQSSTENFVVQQPTQTAVAAAPEAAPATTDSSLTSWVNVTNTDYLKGLALGAGIALVATNPTVQKAVVSGTVKLWAALQGGVEELKEQVQDAKAEISQQD